MGRNSHRKDPSADDPLFRSIDANDGAGDFTNLRQHALVRVSLKLPVDENGNTLIWPTDDPNATEVSVWRAVPSVLNTAITAPYQLDGRFATLQEQADGAFAAHSQIIGVAPKILDDLTAFEKGSFSSPRIRLLSDAIANNQPLPQTDPDDLTALETRGKALFDHHCTGCHGGPSQTALSPMLPEATRDIFVSKPVPPFAADLPYAPSPVRPRLWAFRAGQGPIPSTDPGKALFTGSVNDFNHFDIPSLYGISKTAPYFHDNSAKDLDAVIRLYQSDFIALRPDHWFHRVVEDRINCGKPRLTRNARGICESMGA